MISEKAFQKANSPPKEQSLEYLFQIHEEPFASGAGNSNADKGKEIVLRTDFKSHAQDEYVPTEMKLDEILNNIFHLSRVISQLKNDKLSTSMFVDQVKASLIGFLKSIVIDVQSLVASLDSLIKKFAVNLINSQQVISKEIEIVKSSVSKICDYVEGILDKLSTQMNSALSMLSKVSNAQIDKKGEEKRKNEESNKKRTKPSDKRTDRGPDPKKYKS